MVFPALVPAQMILTGTGNSNAVQYAYIVRQIYPHDADAYTEGLVFHNGYLYESTGLRGSSVLKKAGLSTGETAAVIKLDNSLFGEGIATSGSRIVQLTYKSGKALVYDADSFSLIGEFAYSGEGWGLAYDGEYFIMSNGSETLAFLDTETFRKQRSVRVMDGFTPIDMLNELEYINGIIYANVFKTDIIVMIDPLTGSVTGRIDLTQLRKENEPCGEVLNGIAWDSNNKRLFVTGKRWAHVYEIEIIPDALSGK